MAYRLLPGIVEKIERVLAELAVRPVEASHTPAVAAKKKSRVYMTPVITARGATLWFKSSLQDWAWVRETLREEIRIHRLFAEYEKKHRPSFASPALVAGHDDRRGHVWFLRKYWDGLPAGDMNDEFGYSDQFYRRVTPAAFARALRDVRAMTPFVRRNFQPTSHQLRWYLTDWSYYRQTFWRPLLAHPLNLGWSKKDLDAAEAWLIEQRPFIARHATTFTHGDLYPNNVMLAPGLRRSLVLFDWELSHANLPTFDPMMVYLQAWRRPAWQSAFRRLVLRDLGDTPTTRRQWQIAQLSLTTRLAAFAFHRLTNSLPDRYPPLAKKHRPLVRRLWRAMSRELQDIMSVVG